MRLTMCKSKLHRATVTQCELDYEGSITIDEALLEAAGILPYEKVQVVNIDNGARLETYTYAGRRGSGMICINGAAARMCQVGDKVIIIAYCEMEPEEAKAHCLVLVLLDEHNAVREIVRNTPQPVLHQHSREC